MRGQVRTAGWTRLRSEGVLRSLLLHLLLHHHYHYLPPTAAFRSCFAHPRRACTYMYRLHQPTTRETIGRLGGCCGRPIRCRRGEGRGASADQPRRCSVRHSPPPLRCTVLRCAGAWWMAPENSVSQLPRGCFDLGWGRIARTSRVVTRGVLYSAQVGEGRRYLYGCSEAAGDGLCMCPVGGLLSR